jgi:hypothetical protein
MAKAITVGDYADTWVAQRTFKPRTRLLHRDLLQLHIIPAMGDIALTRCNSYAMGCCTRSAAVVR